MSYEDDGERTERMIFGLPYRATCAEARWVMLETHKLPAYQEHLAADDLLKSPGATAFAADHLKQISTLNIMTYRRLVEGVAKIIEQMEASR